MDFIEFDMEAPEDITVLAATEQGLWATVFVNLIEDNPSLIVDNLVPAAEAVGFRHLKLTLERYHSFDHRSWEQHQAFVTSLVSYIDSQSAPQHRQPDA